MDFINRDSELGFLLSKWDSMSAQLIVVYGKRRVGKTELVIQFAKKRPHIYFLCERLSNRSQLKKFTLKLAEFFKDEFLPKQGFEDWETVFKYVAQKKQRMVIAIDEFPYLVETEPSVPSQFQKAWDLYLKDSNVFLILLGSSISMMEKTVLFYKAPLYGRRTGQILLKPFKIAEAKKLLRGKTFEDVLTAYSIVGGTVSYLKRFKDREWGDVLNEDILTKGEPLYEEVEFLLREEFKEPRNYFAILEALSLGKHKLSEIINETGLDKGIASRYLSILSDLQITRKEVPVTEKMPQKSRNSLYSICDIFFNFWFRFVFRNRSLLEEGRRGEVFRRIVSSLADIESKSYESVAGDIISSAVADGKIEVDFSDYGRWWNKNEEIDLACLNKEANAILFGEAKWSNRPVGTNIYEGLKKKAGLVEWGKKERKEYFALFSKSGFTPDMLKLAKKDGVFCFEKDHLLDTTKISL